MKTIDTLTVYLGSSGKARDVYKDAAETLGTLIAAHGKKLVYGGMDAGLMGVVSSAALEHGAHVTGIIPRKIKDSERILAGLSDTILVEELCERKKLMFQRADAIISLPGGFGTLDESLEVLYWGALGLHNKPLVLVNIEGYWDDVISFLRPLPDFDGRFLIVVEGVDEVFPALEQWQARPAPQSEALHYPHFEDEIMRNTNRALIIDTASVENAYFLVCAIGLKQLGKHRRLIGVINEGDLFNGLLRWFETAQRETFITPKCLKLFDSAADETSLNALLEHQENVSIDLHAEKWGERRKNKRD